MNNDKLSRRGFLGRALSIGAVGVVGGTLVACGKKEGGGEAAGCDDTSKLAEADKTVRTSSKYVEATPHKEKRCDNCMHWVPAEAGKPCGGCKVVKGTINPAGYCNLWVKKPA